MIIILEQFKFLGEKEMNKIYWLAEYTTPYNRP